MSLLPGTILFPSMPLARVEIDESGKVKDGGICTIEMNWWLFFYNISQSVLGTPGGGQTIGLPAAGLIEIASLEADADDADAIVSRQGISSALVQSFQPQDVTLTDADLPSIARALLLAQDGFLQETQPLAQPVQTISVGGSPFTYTAPFNGHVAVTGGTVSAISIIRQGTTVATGLTAGVIPASRADQIKVTYTGVPAMTFIPL